MTGHQLCHYLWHYLTQHQQFSRGQALLFYSPQPDIFHSHTLKEEYYYCKSDTGRERWD